MSLIYHYTTESKLAQIIASGELRVSEWERQNNVKPPALWLTINVEWEPTATKMIKTPFGLKNPSKEDFHKISPLIRFVVPFRKEELCTWGKYRYISNTPLDMYLAMEKVGVDKGANPAEWYASFKNIPLKDVISCERWNGQKWLSHNIFQSVKVAS
jgi:hypothetical protein